MICKRCKNVQAIYFEECRRLDENIFEHLQYVEQLSSFTLRSFKQSFVKLKKLENNQYLTHLDIDGSLISDIEAFQIVKLKSLAHLSIKSNPLAMQIASF
jgi:Leucine-rich repeat (LRR) protein